VAQLTMDSFSRPVDANDRRSSMAKHRHLRFADVDSVAAEVRRLRGGYDRAGNWSLEQVCWHLDKALSTSMQPGPHAPAPAGLIRRLQLKIILTTGRIPIRVQGPQRVMPPAQIDPAAIDDFLLTLQALGAFEGQFKPHPMFGPMDRDRFLRLHMIHCAHHLGFLVPAGRN
jgi:hypothetical protein